MVCLELRIWNVELRNIEEKGKNESKSGVYWGLFVVNLKKQSQFAKGHNERKYLYEREIWRFKRLGAAKKQSQFKAKQTQSYLAPRFIFIWGLKTRIEKTKPIYKGSK